MTSYRARLKKNNDKLELEIIFFILVNTRVLCPYTGHCIGHYYRFELISYQE